MTLSEFIEKYDFENSFVLLEGKRTVLECDQEKLVALGKLLSSKTQKMTFRSGNADGSDYFFSLGVAEIDYKRLEVITPYSGHRKNKNKAYVTHSLDDIDLVAETEVIYQSKNNKKTENLIDQYVSGDKNRFAIKAAYIIRDTVKVLGTTNIKPATYGIFYDENIYKQTSLLIV